MRFQYRIGPLLAGGLSRRRARGCGNDVPGVASAFPGSPAPRPRPASRATGVVFDGVGGGATSPTITVTGTGFGTRPPGQPDTCGPYTGDYYGANFYFWDGTTFWAAGLSGDCVGIVISSWTATEIVFSFGSAYGPNAGWTLHNGSNRATSSGPSGTSATTTRSGSSRSTTPGTRSAHC